MVPCNLLAPNQPPIPNLLKHSIVRTEVEGTSMHWGGVLCSVRRRHVWTTFSFDLNYQRCRVCGALQLHPVLAEEEPTLPPTDSLVR